MQEPPESRRPASLVAVVLDQHADDEHLGAQGNNACGRHLYNAHFKFL